MFADDDKFRGALPHPGPHPPDHKAAPAAKYEYLNGMRKLILTLFLSVAALTTALAQQLDTLSFRLGDEIDDQSAHRLMVCVLSVEGVDDIWFDLEKGVATVSYDPQKVAPDAIMSPVKGIRFTPTPYRANEVIMRSGMQRLELTCAADTARALAALQGCKGIDSLRASLEGSYLSYRYDANKTCKAAIQKLLIDAGFTPCNSSTSPLICFASFRIPALMATQETLQRALALHGVEDASVNPNTSTLAITYYSNLSSRPELKAQLENLGMEVR